MAVFFKLKKRIKIQLIEGALIESLRYRKPSNNAAGIVTEAHETPFSGAIERKT